MYSMGACEREVLARGAGAVGRPREWRRALRVARSVGPGPHGIVKSRAAKRLVWGERCGAEVGRVGRRGVTGAGRAARATTQDGGENQEREGALAKHNPGLVAGDARRPNRTMIGTCLHSMP